MSKPRVSVIGVGYVGLCTAIGFAYKGYNVIGSDADSEKLAKLSKGEPTFHEPGLETKLKEVIENGNFTLTNKTEAAVLQSDVTFLTVGTPSNEDGSINLQYIEAAANDIGRALKHKSGFHVTAVKSTVVPGTTQNLVKSALEMQSTKKCGEGFGLSMNPEFLRQGSAFKDTLQPDRIIIGSQDKKSADIMESLYKGLYKPQLPVIIKTSLATAELIKYASNSFLACKISFVNMIANICERIPGADVKTVALAMGLDKRIGSQFLDAGLGYGGSCFPKDVKALIANSKSLGYTPSLLESVEEVNHAQALRAVELCKELVGNLKRSRIAILGLAFKPDTDDMREARAIPIINQLLDEGAKVIAYDPVAITVAKTIFGTKIEYCSSTVDCLKNTDCCIIVTEWEEFKKFKPKDFIRQMKTPKIVDGRRIYDPEEFQSKTQFRAIGLGT
jgi:UDPglucose 6-dehydrogenase